MTTEDSDPYVRLDKQEIYRNRWVGVEVHEIVHPTGVRGEHVLIATGSASCVLVVDGEEVILAEQPRFAARRTIVEIVKGGADPGEDALSCAQRELLEELGLIARTWTPLGIAYEIPSIVDQPVTLFAASDLEMAQSDPEEVERIEPLRMTFGEAWQRAVDGRISDAVTMAALMRYRAYRDAQSGG